MISAVGTCSSQFLSTTYGAYEQRNRTKSSQSGGLEDARESINRFAADEYLF